MGARIGARLKDPPLLPPVTANAAPVARVHAITAVNNAMAALRLHHFKATLVWCLKCAKCTAQAARRLAADCLESTLSRDLPNKVEETAVGFTILINRYGCVLETIEFIVDLGKTTAWRLWIGRVEGTKAKV